MDKNFKVFTDIGEILTLQGVESKRGRRVQESDLALVNDAVLVCVNGRIAWVGAKRDFDSRLLSTFGPTGEAEEISLGGRCVLPGFVEAHTHLIFAGSRAHEFEARLQGQSYQEIAAKGGGIRFTVDQTRRASVMDLQAAAQARADRFVQQGVATLEVKSGYGLDLETELRSLHAARALRGPRVVTTYLGAHSRSPEIPDYDEYVKWLCKTALLRVAREKLADRVDIYVEKGFFTPAHARQYLEKAKELGLGLTAHVEQLSDSGGAEAALAFGPQSLDHLVFASDSLIAKLAASNTVAMLLPASDFYLRMAYPRARAMIDAGVNVALSTDFNPGTSPTQDLSFVGMLARLEMKMSLPEVIAAYTWSAAQALGAADRGCLSVGKLCDFISLQGSWRELFYTVGRQPVHAVYCSGERIFHA
jgi:imidazolonepropionase